MTFAIALTILFWFAIFALSAVLNDDRERNRDSFERQRLGDHYHDLVDRHDTMPHGVGDQYWLAKKQLELTAAEEMSRIAGGIPAPESGHSPTDGGYV